MAINRRGKVDDGRAMVAAIEAAGGRAVPVEMDIAIEADVQRGFAEVREAFGGHDLLVNNAGIEKPFVGATLFVDGGMTLYPKFV